MSRYLAKHRNESSAAARERVPLPVERDQHAAHVGFYSVGKSRAGRMALRASARPGSRPWFPAALDLQDMLAGLEREVDHLHDPRALQAMAVPGRLDRLPAFQHVDPAARAQGHAIGAGLVDTGETIPALSPTSFARLGPSPKWTLVPGESRASMALPGAIRAAARPAGSIAAVSFALLDHPASSGEELAWRLCRSWRWRAPASGRRRVRQRPGPQEPECLHGSAFAPIAVFGYIRCAIFFQWSFPRPRSPPVPLPDKAS